MTPTGCAVVVGATGALGGGILARLRKAGLPTLAVARTETELAKLAAEDPGIVPCPADIGEDGAVDTLRSALEAPELTGPVRMAVLVAGLPVGGTIDQLDLSLVTRAVDLKVNGLIRLLRALGDRLVDGSRLVAVGGHYGSEPSPNAPMAGVTNAALANLVRQLADHLGPRGITVHLVAPGPVDTDRLRRIAAAGAAGRGIEPEQVLEEYRAASPLGRLTTIDEVAWAVGCLLEPEAAALTGSTLALDAGRRRGIG